MFNVLIFDVTKYVHYIKILQSSTSKVYLSTYSKLLCTGLFVILSSWCMCITHGESSGCTYVLYVFLFHSFAFIYSPLTPANIHILGQNMAKHKCLSGSVCEDIFSYSVLSLMLLPVSHSSQYLSCHGLFCSYNISQIQ